MNLVPTPFKIVFGLMVLCLALFLSCSTSTEPGDDPPPLNKWPSKPELDTDNGNGAPALNAQNVSVNTKLKWTSTDPDDDPLSFDVYLEADNPSPGKVASDIAEMSFAPNPALKHSKKYYWKVAAKDGHNHVAMSPVWNFTTADPPNNPLIEISASILDFGAGDSILEFTLKNIGTGRLEWNIAELVNTDWLSFSPPLGEIPAGSSITITIRVDRSGLATGFYTADLTIWSNHGAGKDIVRVEMWAADYFGELSIVYSHSGDTLPWTFTDSIAADFVLSVNNPNVTGTFEAVQFVTIVTDTCAYDSLKSLPFKGTITGTDLIDSLVFDFSPDSIPLSFKLDCSGTDVPVPLYRWPIRLHLLALGVSIEALDGAFDSEIDSVSVFTSWPDMQYVYKVTIHKP